MDDPVNEALNRAALEVTPVDIDNIIAFLRKSKASYEKGEKPKKEGEGFDVLAALNVVPKASPGFKRRF
jgi:hypothetical protein